MWRNREVHGDARIHPNHPWPSIMGWVHQYKQVDISVVGGHTKH